MCPATWLMPNRWHTAVVRVCGDGSCHSEDPATFPRDPGAVGPKPPAAASLRPHGSHTIRVAAWHLELLFGGPGRGGDTAARA